MHSSYRRIHTKVLSQLAQGEEDTHPPLNDEDLLADTIFAMAAGKLSSSVFYLETLNNMTFRLRYHSRNSDHHHFLPPQ